jgi:ABC-type multidrug transport system fused ATPase/permease subunit
MINVSEEVKKILQTDMLKSFIKADTETIDSNHSGKYISNLNFDVNQITRMLSEAYLSIFKDGLTLIGLLFVMFFQNWKLSLIAIIMIPLASITAKILGKRMSKISTQAQEKSGDLNRYLIDLFKNHKIIKIFQRENFSGGKMTALVGHSGSGKSTLLNMIPRIYAPTDGTINLDDQDISKFNLSSLRSEISIVDQNTTLFDDTVLNNIKYARPEASNEEVYEAAEQSMCNEFISNLENGYETMIGENGVKLSGGEKQRLSIARAFLKKSKIILLDEATSSLDSKTEAKIQKALDQLTLNKTTIVIAHRLSTILNSDKIYVVDSGKIIDSGKHEELLIQSKVYKNFYERQIKEH